MELFKLLGTIAIKNDEANKALDETSKKGEKAESKLGKAFGTIGKGAVAVGKVVAKGMAVGAAGVTALVTKSVASYADYEQLVGGVETLFKESASTVKGYADRAYETAGLSANDYMNTVTSFSASLLQSLGNDTAAAADKADMAITDMADNANKMGSSMESIQNAYQGFAKQNYTMLDNLKLGYGGTKEEMARLLKDAEKISGIKYDLSSYADVVDAIHVMQEEMGIAGTTAKEASTTISGSIGTMKAQWQNLVTALSGDGWDLGVYVENLVSSVATVASNLMPVIGTALDGVVQLIDQIAPIIIGKIPDLFSQLLPSVLSAATGLLNSIVSEIPALIDMLVNSVIPQFLSSIGTVVNSLISALPSVMQSICSALPTLLPMLIDSVCSVVLMLVNNIQQIVQPITDSLPDIIISVIDALLSNLPMLIEGVISLVLGIVREGPKIVENLVSYIPTVVEMIVTSILENTPTIIAGIAQVVWEIIKSLPSLLGSLKDSIVNAFIGIWNGIKNVFSNTDTWFGATFQKAVNWVKNAWSSVTGFFSNIKNGIVNAFSNIWEKLTSPFRKASDTIKEIADKIKGFFKGEISLPKIKLPHFSLSPAGWKIGDLLKGSIPKLSIKWYAEAMNNPMLLNDPTIFGYNAKTGSFLGGGEAGAEVVSGANTLMNMIGEAVENRTAAANEKIISVLLAILDAIMTGNKDTLKALLAGQTLTWNNREVARMVREYA